MAQGFRWDAQGVTEGRLLKRIFDFALQGIAHHEMNEPLGKWTPLVHALNDSVDEAASEGKFKLLKSLLELGASSNVYLIDTLWDIPDLRIMKLFHDYKVIDMTKIEDEGCSPITHWLMRNDISLEDFHELTSGLVLPEDILFGLVMRPSHVEILKSIDWAEPQWEKFIGYKNSFGFSPVHYVASLEIAKILEAHGAYFNVKDDDGFNPLMRGICRSHNLDVKLLDFFIEKGNRCDITSDGTGIIHELLRYPDSPALPDKLRFLSERKLVSLGMLNKYKSFLQEAIFSECLKILDSAAGDHADHMDIGGDELLAAPAAPAAPALGDMDLQQE
ncbi:MAG UNVERIFIED_CONTAM: hypothetical protein LVQ98_04015 [Rickettsiaceae bacterium]|jgi:hypothetical protein